MKQTVKGLGVPCWAARAVATKLVLGGATWLFASLAFAQEPAPFAASWEDAGTPLADAAVPLARAEDDAASLPAVADGGLPVVAAPSVADAGTVPTLFAEDAGSSEGNADLLVATGEPEPSVNALGTVLVTARYRPEDVQDVPIAITTLSGAQLQALGGTRSLSNLVGQLPALNLQGFSGRNQTITIRGLGTNAGGTNDGLEQGVGLYIDGVYRPRTGSVITDLVDVESIQLLRGPQGTLFGKNTVAGAIDIRTTEPVFERQAKAEFTYGKFNYARAYFSATNPFSKTLTVRVSYLRTKRDGLIYATNFNQDWDNLNNDAVRADLLWKPLDNFKSRLIADYSMQSCDCGFYVTKSALPTTLANGKTVRGFYDKAASVGYNPIAVEPFARKTDINASQADRMPSWGLQNRADWRVGHDITLTSISSYRNWKWLPHYDGDQFGADISPLGIVETHQQQASQELRVSSPGGELIDYTAGLYAFWQRANDFQYSTYGTQASQWLISPQTSPSVLNRLVAFSHVIPATQSYAAFGQATYNPSSSWHLTGGARLTYEHKTGSYHAASQGDVAPLDSLPADQQAAAAASRASYAPTGDYKDTLNVQNVSGTAVLAHDFSDNIHTFLSYSRGYKSPGINVVKKSLGVDVFVKPEKVDNVELGTKAAFFGGRWEINPNLFYAIDRRYQASYANTNVSPTAVYIANVGTLVSRGVEVDSRLFALQSLMASASFMYNDARYQSYKSAPAQYQQSFLGTQDLSGKQASGAPRYVAGAALEYFTQLAPSLNNEKGDVVGYLGGDWSYRSHFRSAINLDPLSNVPGYMLLALHAGIRSGKTWDLSLWMRNVANKNYYNTVSVNAQYGISQAALGEPRTFGATLRGQI